MMYVFRFVLRHAWKMGWSESRDCPVILQSDGLVYGSEMQKD